MVNVEYKTCSSCGQSFPATTEHFYANPRNSDGLFGYCKLCALEGQKRRRARRREEKALEEALWLETHREEVDATERAKEEERKKHRSQYLKSYYAEHEEQYAKNREAWRKKNPNYFSEYNAAHKEKRDAWQEGHREHNNKRGRVYYWQHHEERLEYNREYSRENRDKFREYARALNLDPKHRLNHTISSGIRSSLRGNKNGRHWEDLVGYTREDLKRHLESQFTEGMTWDNLGRKGWTIDHMKPIAAWNFTSPDDPDFKECWALSNLQPMWFRENSSKNAKYQGIDYRYVDKSAGGGS